MWEGWTPGYGELSSLEGILCRTAAAAADDRVVQESDLVGAADVVDPAAPRPKPPGEDGDRYLLREAGWDDGPLEVPQMEVQHFTTRVLDHDQNADVRNRLGRPVLERSREGGQGAAFGEDSELFDDVVEVDQVLESVALTQIEGGRHRRIEGDRGGREVAQQIHREREVQVLPFGGRRRRDPDHAAHGVEDGPAAAPGADRCRDLQELDVAPSPSQRATRRAWRRTRSGESPGRTCGRSSKSSPRLRAGRASAR